MTMTPAQRKEAMPHGGQRRAATRAQVSDTYAAMVMSGVARVSTPRGLRNLRRVQRELAREMGKTVTEAFGAVHLARSEAA